MLGDLSIYVAIQHPRLVEVKIELIDPRGNKVYLIHEPLFVRPEITYGYEGETVDGLRKLRYLPAKGRWTLKFTDESHADAGFLQAVRVVQFKSVKYVPPSP